MEVMVRDSRPDTYRTTLVERWRTALTSHVLRQWFPGEQESIDSLRDADEALRKEREQQHALQLDRAMERLFDPATYQDGRVQPKPEEWDSAVALLQQAYALYYAPSSKKATNTGPFFCFTKESFRRLLVDDGIPAILMDEVMRTLKNDQKITETSEPIHFKVGGSKRMIKVDISAYPGLLTCLQHLQQNLEG